MTFAHPTILLFLVLPLGLTYWTWRRGAPPVPLPTDSVTAGRGRFLQAITDSAASLPAILLAIAILLLAGPQRLADPTSERVVTNIQFCLDVSGSMTAAFGDGDRYDAAMESINEFINYREGDSFGLTIFGSSLLHWIRVTNDPSAFRYATPFLSPRRLPRWFGGGTRIGYALRSCLDLLIERKEGDRMILLVSDGYSSDLSGGQDAEIARELAANNIVVYAVHVAEGAAPAEVATIAHSTGGEVFAAGDPAALQEVFQRIDKMQGARTETVSAEPVDDFRPYVFAGFGCLGLLFVSMLGVRYTPW